MNQEHNRFREDITRIFDALLKQRGSASDVAWKDLVDAYVVDFNGFNPMTTTTKLLEIAKQIPLLEIPDEHGVRFMFSTLHSSTERTFSTARVIVQKVKQARVLYRMECEASIPLGNCPSGYTPDFMVPPVEFGELVDYTVPEDE